LAQGKRTNKPLLESTTIDDADRRNYAQTLRKIQEEDVRLLYNIETLKSCIEQIDATKIASAAKS
jgi:hypothetical protein